MICGLDISTSITGITILNNNGVVLMNDYWDLRKCKTFYDKISFAREKIKELKAEYKIEQFLIEQSLQAFRPGFSSAKTILTLAKFNGTVSWLVYDIFGLEPEYIGATTARKTCGITVPRGTKAKKVVMQYMHDNHSSWFKIILTPKGNPKPYFFDMADSYVVAYAGFLNARRRETFNIS